MTQEETIKFCNKHFAKCLADPSTGMYMKAALERGRALTMEEERLMNIKYMRETLNYNPYGRDFNHDHDDRVAQ